MRTKQLFYTLALSTAFVACSQEEFVESNNSTFNDGREVVGKVTITPELSGLDSRLTYEAGKPSFDNTDKIGAVLMDEWSKYNVPQFTLKDYLQTNYMYRTNDEGKSWYSDALMAEGNYFFYLPYNKDMRERGGAMYNVVNPNQKAEKDGEFNKYAALEDQYFLGYKFITTEDAEQLPETGLRLTAMHGSLGLKLKYTGTNPVTIKKVAVRKVKSDRKNDYLNNGKAIATTVAGATNVTGAFINGANLYDPMITRVDVKPATTQGLFGFLDPICLLTNEYKLKRNFAGENITPSMTKDYDALMYSLIYPNYKTGLTYQYELSLPNTEEAVLNNGENVSAFMLMPFQNFWYTTDWRDSDAMGEPAAMVLAVYTDKGIFEVPMWLDNADLSKVIANVTVLASMESLKADKVGYFTVEFGQEAAYNKPKTFTVNNSTDLYEHLALYEENKKEAVTLHLYTASEDVRMTKEIYDFLAGHRNIKLTLESGRIKIPAGLEGNVSPIDLVYLSENYNYHGFEALKAVLDRETFDVPAPAIVLEEGAKYATSGLNYTSTSGETIASMIKNALAEQAPNFGISAFNNVAIPAIEVEKGAELTVNGSVKARILNAGTTNIEADAEVIGVFNTNEFNVNKNFAAFHVYNGSTAELTIAEGVAANFALFNDRSLKATEDNCCLLEFEQKYAWEMGLVTIGKEAVVHLYGLKFTAEEDNTDWYGNWGKIVNEGTIKTCYLGNPTNENLELNYCINHGIIENKGKIFDLINDGYVDNDGVLYLAKTTDYSYIDVTGDVHKVTHPNIGNESDNAIYAYQVLDETDAADIPACVNKIIVSSILNTTTDITSVKHLVLLDGAKIIGLATADAPGFTNGVKADVFGKAVLKNTRVQGSVTVWKDATLVNEVKTVFDDIRVIGTFEVLAGTKMYYKGTFSNYGSVEVEGSAEAIKYGEAASYEGTGHWAGNNDPRY